MIRVDSNAAELSRGLGDLGNRTIRRATVFALNDTAADILLDVQDSMRERFDHPTRFALNAFFVWRANVKDEEPYAEVKERPSVGRRHFLKVQEKGGRRPETGLERMLKMMLPRGHEIVAVTPARGARLNAAGNWSPGQRNQAISAVKGFREVGYNANRTSASAARRPGRDDFFIPQEGSRLSAGIYSRSKTGARAVRKIVHFTKGQPNYRPLLGFFDGGQEVFDREYARHFARIFARLSSRERST